MLLFNQCRSMGDTPRMEGWLADCEIQEKSLTTGGECLYMYWPVILEDGSKPKPTVAIRHHRNTLKGFKQMQSKHAVAFLFNQRKKKSW